MSPEELRDLIAQGEIDESDPIAVSIAIERFENALNVVLDELQRPVSEDSNIVLMNRHRVAGDIAQALGLEVKA